MLQIQHLQVGILKDISLTVANGESVAILGSRVAEKRRFSMPLLVIRIIRGVLHLTNVLGITLPLGKDVVVI